MKNIIPFLLLLLFSCSEKDNQKTELYRAGFTAIHSTDKSRIFKPDTYTTDYLHYRPVDVDIWYPADSSATDTSVMVQDLLTLLEQRGNYYSASNAATGVAGQLAKFFCDVFKCSDSATLLRFKTNSFKNAKAVTGKFPLVIYMCAFDGMSYENFALFDSLARKGFVVASITSNGRFPGSMTTKYADLMEQVYDAVFSVGLLKENPNIDFTKIGIVGYSWGGLSGAILAGRIPNVKCLVSLEGSEYHHYGDAKDENANFDTIRSSTDFADLHLAVPYLRLESAPSAQPEKFDSVYNFSANHVDSAQIYTIDSAGHEDFDCFSMIVKEAGNCEGNQRYKTALQLTVDFLEDYLKNENHFSKTLAEKMDKTIRKK